VLIVGKIIVRSAVIIKIGNYIVRQNVKKNMKLQKIKIDYPETMAFCWNSRRWVILLDIFGSLETCPERGMGERDCIGKGCGYYEERKPTEYAKELYRKIRSLGDPVQAEGRKE
jgi:hypothetical protein